MQKEIGTVQKYLSAMVSIIKITIEEFSNNNLSLRSSALTYTILLSLVPMLAMSTAVVKGLGGGGHLKEVAYTYIDTLDKSSQILPGQRDSATNESSEITNHLRSAVDQIFDYVDKTNFATLGSFGVAGILLSVIIVLSHIETAMNTIWKVQKSRSVMRKISDYLTLLILVPISINLAFAASALLKSPALTSQISIIVPALWVQTLIFKFLPIFFISLTLLVIYMFFPNTNVRTKYAAVGAIVAGTFWFIAQNIYLGLQIGVANYNAIYGSFATLPLFLIWIYLGWIFILTGAQLAFALQNRKYFSSKKDITTPALRLSLCFDIMKLAQDNYKAENILTDDLVFNKLRNYDKNLVNKMISFLISNKALYLINDNKLIPSAPEDKLSNGKLCAMVLGEVEIDSLGGQVSRKIVKAAADGVNNSV